MTRYIYEQYDELRRYADTLECAVVRMAYEDPAVAHLLTDAEKDALHRARTARSADDSWRPGYGGDKGRGVDHEGEPICPECEDYGMNGRCPKCGRFTTYEQWWQIALKLAEQLRSSKEPF